MDIRILPCVPSGTVTPPPSKSVSHRLIIAAALGDGESTLRNVSFSQDIEATLRCMEALGARWDRPEPTTVRIRGIGGISRHFSELPVFDCGESGSTLRFLIPIALAVAGGGVFTGRGRLMERPQQPYSELFDQRGIFYTNSDGVLTVRGKLEAGEYRLAGNVSSQFFTGLLFALPLLEGPSSIISTTTLESSDYITMTLEALRTAGISAQSQAGGSSFRVLPGSYGSFTAAIEADWSQAGFWYAAKALGCSLELAGLNFTSAQGDMVVAAHYQQLTQAGDLEIDVSGCPDLLPPLAVMAAVRQGRTRFLNAARLRLKESDRLSTTSAMLRALGGCVTEQEDGLIVQGVPSLTGGTVDGANDHRIVMAAAIAAIACRRPVTILGAEAVKKSYPDFFRVYQALGGDAHGI